MDTSKFNLFNFPIPLKVKLLNANAKLPTIGMEGDIGIDLYANEKITINGQNQKTIGTGIAVEIPEGYYGQIFDRSGFAHQRPLGVKAGVIESTYRGEVKVILFNHSPGPEKIFAGEGLAQLVILPVPQIEITEVEELSTTERGEKGFGSTDQ